MRQWKTLPFDEVMSDETSGNLKTLASDFLPDGPYPIVDQGKGLIAGYTNEAGRLCKTVLPVIVFGDHTRALKFIDFPFCLGADGTKVLQSKNGADPKYLYHYLKDVDLPDAGYSRHFKFLKRIEIRLPPVPEQRRIAAILDQADALQAKRRAAMKQLNDLAHAAFLDMFGDPLGNSKGWRKVRISEVGEVITGNTPSRQVEANYGDGMEWMKSDNINTGAYYATSARERLSPSGQLVARTAPVNSILVTCIAGSPNSIGNSAMLDREAAFNQQINAVVPKACNPHFLYAQLRVGKKMVQEMSTEGMKGLVSKSRFEQIKVIVPPPALQAEFAEKTLMIERTRHASGEALKVTNALLASLQHRAFRGEL